MHTPTTNSERRFTDDADAAQSQWHGDAMQHSTATMRAKAVTERQSAEAATSEALGSEQEAA